LVLSYMRGRVPNMHRVMDLCQKYDMQLLEDSAHGYGCSFDGKMCGSFGVVSTISTQANKLVNTGEGGMVFTNNDDMQAFFIFSACSYEELWRKHEELAPPEEVCLKYKYTVSNKSVRMTNIQGALLYPQLMVMTDRIDQHNSMYYHLVSRTGAKLVESCGEGAARRIEFIGQAHELVGPVYDSLQFRIRQEDGSMAVEEIAGLNDFLKMVQGRKYSIAKFSDPANARNYLSWQYLKAGEILPEALPQTTRFLANVCDLRLLCHDTEVEMEQLATNLVECLRATVLR
jgi:dTDP-4-amino-4,6-dideoxygalactose transaminase